jgi:hypothetical protein
MLEFGTYSNFTIEKLQLSLLKFIDINIGWWKSSVNLLTEVHPRIKFV